MSLSSKQTCGHCNNIAPMQILGSADDNDTWGNPAEGPTLDVADIYLILKCPACTKINLITYFWRDNWDEDDKADYQLLYPNNKSIPEGLPDEIRSSYLAAEKVKNIDVNAYAILIRRLLEIVCLERGAQRDTLAKMLRELADKKEIPEKLVDVADGLRNFGNIGAHAGSGELGKNEIPIVQALAIAILEYLFSAPHLANVAESKLKSIRNGVKKNN